MQLRRYEALMLTVPEITQDEVKVIENSLDGVVKAAKGSVISFERWGKYRLAYAVDKKDYGVYFLIRFEAPADSKVNEELKSLFAIKLHEIVVRNTVARLADAGSLEYHRPKSLEESPSSRDVEKFLKDNKMTGLLNKSDRKSSDMLDDEFGDEGSDVDHFDNDDQE
jgi:small subunit ribosomal protein S6